MENQLSIEEITTKLKDIFPQIAGKYEILKLGRYGSEVKLFSNKDDLRPGNTVSGPSMFELADISFYVALMASSEVGEFSVTTNVSINFLKKPLLSNLIAVSKINKLGKNLVMGDVKILSIDKKNIYAQAIFTYSIPRN